MSHRPGLLSLFCCLAGLCALLSSMPARAGAAVELLFWSRDYQGSIAGKAVTVSLTRLAGTISGQYCYLPCTEAKRSRLQLTGKLLPDGRVMLAERDIGDGKTQGKASGQWRGLLQGEALSGDWLSPDGKRRAPLLLTQWRENRPFPYEIRLLASGQPKDDDRCNDVPSVSAIRLYDKGRLVQELATDSQGTCSMFLPETVDANFDGWPDLMLAQTLPAGPNIPYQFWLYNPKTRRFVEAPELNEVSSPMFDAANKVVWTAWRASCCEHGVTTWRWQGGKLVEGESQSSYVLPVMDGAVRRYCYVVPDYDNGAIVFRDRVEQGVDGRLRLSFSDLKDCEAKDDFMPERAALEVWRQDAASGQWRVVRREEPGWKKTATAKGARWCRELPFFDKGRIRRIVLQDDPDNCETSDPDQPASAN